MQRQIHVETKRKQAKEKEIIQQYRQSENELIYVNILCLQENI